MTHTPGPWDWVIEDYSMATLCGPNSAGYHDGVEGHVVSIGPCKACQNHADPKEWKWGRCTTATIDDAQLIAAAPELLEELIAVRESCLFADDDGQIGVTSEPTIDSDQFKRICAAIAKATEFEQAPTSNHPEELV